MAKKTNKFKINDIIITLNGSTPYEVYRINSIIEDNIKGVTTEYYSMTCILDFSHGVNEILSFSTT